MCENGSSPAAEASKSGPRKCTGHVILQTRHQHFLEMDEPCGMCLRRRNCSLTTLPTRTRLECRPHGSTAPCASPLSPITAGSASEGTRKRNAYEKQSSQAATWSSSAIAVWIKLATTILRVYRLGKGAVAIAFIVRPARVTDACFNDSVGIRNNSHTRTSLPR